jgi:hypothetical protein
MMRRALEVTAMLTLGMALPLSPATADPIRITGGSAIFDEFAHATVDIHGFEGLHAQFQNGLLNNNGPWQCGVGGPCPPGTRLTPFGFIESIDGAGTAQFRGVSYQLGSTFATMPGTGVISIRPFGATVVVPPFADRRVTLTTPFELPTTNGSFFESFFEFSPREDEFIHLPLSGKGIFTWS